MIEENTSTPSIKMVYDLDLADFQEVFRSWNEPIFRAQQVWEGLYHHYISSPDQLTSLSKVLRTRLADNFKFSVLSPVRSLQSKDGLTIKTLFRLVDGQAIESVLMCYDKRNTLCISTQVGCAMGCVFCATGQMGFRRNLTSGEIVEQVIYYARQLASTGENVTNVVIMGMGEPFHNYANTLAAVDRLNDEKGYQFGARRVTISTVGIVPMIRKFAEEKRQVNLAISLHAASDQLRSSLLPVNNKYPLAELFDAIRYYIELTNRRITFEWALIEGVNDTPEQARLLISLAKGLLCHVNVIPLNPTEEFVGKAATRERAEAFQKVLTDAGIPCTIRLRRGIEIQAGCGQLAALDDPSTQI
jgi:23S rRNA (adenine2503-C2)-methyltransferase